MLLVNKTGGYRKAKVNPMVNIFFGSSSSRIATIRKILDVNTIIKSGKMNALPYTEKILVFLQSHFDKSRWHRRDLFVSALTKNKTKTKTKRQKEQLNYVKWQVFVFGSVLCFCFMFLFCFVLFCFVLFCFVLFCLVSFRFVSFRFVSFRFVLFFWYRFENMLIENYWTYLLVEK